MNTTFLQSLAGELAFNITEENLKIRADQIRARLSLYMVMIGIQAIGEPLFVFLFWDQADHLHLLIWLTCMYVIHAGDTVLWLRHREHLNTVEDCKRWRTNFNLFTLLTALMWGTIVLWFYPADLAYLSLLISISIALIAGAVTMDSVYPPSLYIYTFGVSLPLLGRLIFTPDITHWALAGMLLLFLFGSLAAGRELSKTVWKSLWQRHENDYLIEELTKQKVIAELASRDKSRFLATASHDLRQPLQALVLFSESLQDISQNKEAQHLSRQISKSVGALVDMFDELLDISKLDAGVIKAVPENFKVQELLDRLHDEFNPVAIAKGLKLEMSPCTLVAHSDPHLVERILRNLISNAIRYTDFGRVSVNCEPWAGNKLKLSVLDTGIGIRAKSLPHIFEEYYQVDNQHRDRLKGLGLGLAIVRRIETLIETKVEVTSKPALGSSFSFAVPQGEIIQLNQIDTKQPLRQDVTGVIVALIDDNRDIRDMATRLLRTWGCKVYEGELPHAVLGEMAACGIRPDLLLCDYRLPYDMTALDGIRLLREHWNTPIPTIVLTGDTAPQTIQDIQNSGALLLHKPIAPAKLRSIMYFALHGLSREKTQ